ncbi:MAG: AraC family transcriptional regulator [Bacteroidales bacterium]|jgi:AraC-like DNA-binding protein|nr:AraC family transcriptional regulator [Bacteroidales bacterium]
MNYSLSISHRDSEETQGFERMSFTGKKVYSCTRNFLEDKSIGYFKEEFNQFANFGIVERNSLFMRDVKITESTDIPLFALSFILEGTNGFRFSKTDSIVRPSTNNIWAFGAGEQRSIMSKKNVKSTVLSFLFHEHYIDDIANRYPQHLEDFYKRYRNNESCCINVNGNTTTPEMTRVLSQIKNAGLMGSASDMYTEAKILELLTLQIADRVECEKIVLTNHCKNISDIEKIKEAKRVLIANLNQPPSIVALSRHVGVNENKLKYGFKEVYNQTVYGYLFDYKMDLAGKLLLDTNKPILEIAFECGYTDASHFTKAFKRKYGISPREFRNRA